MYYKKLLNRKKLLKFWIFLGGQFKDTFKVNYRYINHQYDKKCFLDFNLLCFYIKSISTLLVNLTKTKTVCLFVATKYIYSKQVAKKDYTQTVKKLFLKNSNILSNFYFQDRNLHFKKMILVFLYIKKNDRLLFEAKQQHMPTIALTNLKQSSNLIDYPIVVNSSYFYNIYFFSRLFFRITIFS